MLRSSDLLRRRRSLETRVDFDVQVLIDSISDEFDFS